MASLRELQTVFAHALRDESRSCAVRPAENFAIYRNNSSIGFLGALESSFPVMRRRVGEEYFQQLGRLYRERFPSRSGDLQWVGQHFVEFLDQHLRAGEYHWLTDLARLEWSCELAALHAELPAISVDRLGQFASEQFEHLVFETQPSLRLLASSYPVFSVWQANQADNAPPVDQSLGKEQGIVRIRHEMREVRRLPADLFTYLLALNGGATLGEAMTKAEVADGARLGEILGFAFAEGLICSVGLKGAVPAATLKDGG